MAGARFGPGCPAALLAGVLAVVAGLPGCAPESSVDSSVLSSIDVLSPELTGMEPGVVTAMRDARQAVRDHPDSADAWGELGAVYDAHVLFHLAEVCYRRAGQLAPNDFRWAYLLAIVREVQGADADEVREGFARAAELDPDYAIVPLRLGDALWRRGEYEAARAELERAVGLESRMPLAHRRLGQVLLALGEVQAAVEPLERAIRQRPGDRAAHLALAQALRRLGRDEEAQQAIERSRDLEPTDAIDDPVYSREVADRARGSGRSFNRAMARIRAGDCTAAIEDLGVVLSARPDDADAHYWLGTCHQRLGQAGPALEHLLRAADLRSTLVKARMQAGEVLAATGRYDESAVQLREAIRLTPDNPALYLALADVLIRTGDVEGVVEAYGMAERTIELDPRQRQFYGVALLRTGASAAAVEQLKRAVASAPDRPDPRYHLAEAFVAVGRREDAIAEFREAARLDPQHAAARRLVELGGDPGP